MLRRRDDLAEYARLVQELRLGNDSFQGYFRMSTKQFDYVLGWCDHTFYVYQLCTWLCMCRDVRCRRRTQCERRLCIIYTWTYDVVRPRIYYACRLMHTNDKMATEDDVYDIVLASSSYTRLSNFLVVEMNSTSTLLGSRRSASSR